MKKYLIALMICLPAVCGPALQAGAQEYDGKEKTAYRWTIAMQPLYLANGGLRVDVERKLNRPGSWLQLGVSGFYRGKFEPGEYEYREGWSNFNTCFKDISRHRGIGVGLSFKQFFRDRCFYWSGGVQYAYHRVYYHGYVMDPYTEDGLTYYERNWREVCQQFNKWLPHLLLGYQPSLGDSVFLDLYLGCGYAVSNYDKDKLRFDSDFTGHGYRGFRLVSGVRFGVAI